MKPITTSFTTGKDTCTPISSDCIIWNGPDIPCVTDPCNGESATNVLQLMADKLCELSDQLSGMMEVDLSCLLDGGEPPITLQELQQLVIDKVCEALANGGGGGTVDPGTQKTLYPLPSCLQYVDGDQNTVTSAELADFLDLVSTKVCEIVTDVLSIQDDIEALDIRVTALENVPTITPPTLPNVTLTCTNSTPGIAKPIAAALTEFESAYCQFRVLTGSNSELSSVILKECANLDSSTSLADSDLVMSDLSGWVSTPTTIAQMMNNMWITLCDMRARVEQCCTNLPTLCSPTPVTKVAVTNVNNQSFDVSWNNPNVGTYDQPVEFNIDVYNLANNQPTGSPLLSETVSYPVTFPHTVFNTLDPGVAYGLVVTAVYSCGSASVTAVNVLNEAVPVSLCLDITEFNLPDTTVVCDGTNYTQTNKKLVFTLYETISNNVYQAPTNINIQIVFDSYDECANDTTTLPVNIILQQGNSSIDYSYVASTKEYCVSRTSCSNITLTPNCISINGNGTTVNICAGNKLTECVVISN